MNYKICLDSKIGHINKGMGNINGVPVNKGQFGASINLQFSRREYFIQLVKFCRKRKTISVVFLKDLC